MTSLISPHGSDVLRPLLAQGVNLQTQKELALSLKKVFISSREVSDILMLGMGAYTPLDGFMGEADWYGCCKHMALSSGLFWPIPITLSCPKRVADTLSLGEEIALVDSSNQEIFGILKLEEKYQIDKNLECTSIFLTNDDKHPGVKKVLEQGEVNLAGPVTVLSEGHYPDTYKGLYVRPAETRELFERNGWARIAAFQTRNPMHRSHEYLAKIAIEVCDGVLIHQVLGALKPGDIPAEVRVKAIDALVMNYFAPNTVIQAGYPIEMRYAGPREALLHAVFRQNFGCTHLIVGRDHAGVGNYYGPLDAHRIFDEIGQDKLKIQAFKIDVTFYCHSCNGMATVRTCPHDDSHKLAISGTRLREMFSNHEPIPEEFSRPEVVDVLQKYYDNAE